MTRPQILLMEDDRMIRALVTFALEDMNVDLIACDNVADAQARLARGDITLLIMDLMLPGESGVSFLQRHAAAPLFPPTTLVAVFSAGLTGTVRETLELLAVWRLMPKPASMDGLRQCVTDAIALKMLD
ncbi:hypothetical protein BH11PSE7_BH11PSE7_18690 [soil metagenome]